MTRFTTDLSRTATQLPDALLLLEADGEISWINHAALVLLSIEPAHWLGRQILRFVHDDDHGAVRDAFDSSRADHRAVAREVRVRDGNGAWLHLGVSGREMPATSGGEGFVTLLLRPREPAAA